MAGATAGEPAPMKVAGALALIEAGEPSTAVEALAAPAAPGVVDGWLGRDGRLGEYLVATEQLAPLIRLLT